MKILFTFSLCFVAVPHVAQVNTGELRLKATDSTGLGLKATVALQEQARQIQNGDNFETIGTVSYQHLFSPNLLTNLAGMVLDNASDLYSNPLSTPIIAFQKNSFCEGYFKAAVSFHRGTQELEAGVESDATFLHENFNYFITDPSQFDDGTARRPWECAAQEQRRAINRKFARCVGCFNYFLIFPSFSTVRRQLEL